MRLENKVVVVTGGAQGFGEGIVRRFATEGARIVIADIQAQAAQT
ncbi:MAG: 3-oxoacyl-ACP reductase [Pseudomonadota bacterium]